MDESGELLRRKRLVNRAVRFLPNKTKNLGHAQTRRQYLRVRDRRHLASCVQMLGEARQGGIGVRSNAWVVLIIVFQRERVLRIDYEVQVRYRLIRKKIGGTWN